MTTVFSYVVIDEAVQDAGIAGEGVQAVPNGVIKVCPVHDGEWLIDDTLMAMWGEGSGFFESCLPEDIEEYNVQDIAEKIVEYRIVPAQDQTVDEDEEPYDETISKFIVSRRTFDLWTFQLIVNTCQERQQLLKFKEAEIWILESNGKLSQIW